MTLEHRSKAELFAEIVQLREHNRKLQSHIKQSVQWLSMALRSSPMIISIVNLEDQTYVDINDSWQSTFGYSRAEVIGRRPFDLPIWIEPAFHKFFEIQATGGLPSFEIRYQTKDGSIGFGLLSAQLITTDGKEFVLNTMMDITQRKLAEDRFFKIFHSSPDMIAILRRDEHTYLEVNQTFLDIFGYTREEVIGRSPFELGILSSDDEIIKEAFERLLIEREVKNVEFLNHSKSGQIIYTLVSSVLVNFKEEECRLSIIKDISDKKNYEQELARLDRLNLIGEMAASIGHEIRNPMTAVRGFLQMFNTQEDCGDKRVYYDLMIEELDRANSIITEYLSMARDKTVDLQPQYLNTIIQAIQPMMQAEALMDGKHIHILPGSTQELMLDPNQIRQMILNLVRNGLEAMETGGIVTISTVDEEDGMVLCVQDQGGGIDPDYLDRLGTPFVSSKEAGTGLGLAVCYSIAARHGAKIDFDTGPEGTTFMVNFPKRLEQVVLF